MSKPVSIYESIQKTAKMDNIRSYRIKVFFMIKDLKSYFLAISQNVHVNQANFVFFIYDS